MEAQLAETTAQLRQLQIQQKQLEARNTLLEHVARIHQGPTPGTDEAHDPARQVWQVSVAKMQQRMLVHMLGVLLGLASGLYIQAAVFAIPRFSFYAAPMLCMVSSSPYYASSINHPLANVRLV